MTTTSEKSAFSVLGCAHKFCRALEKAGGGPGDMNRAAEDRELMEGILAYVRGHARLEIVPHVIDCGAAPLISEGWKVLPADQIASRYTGKLVWGKDSPAVALHFDPGQLGDGGVKGEDLKKLLEGQPVLPANVLDYLIAHPALIPESWRDKAVVFWGTIYRDSDGNLCVRALCWGAGRWDWGCSDLGNNCGSQSPAALLAS